MISKESQILYKNLSLGKCQVKPSNLKTERKRVYLDNNATSMIDPHVLEAMYPYFCEHYGNASSLHQDGVVASQAVSQARAKIAALVNAHEDEIIFTSGGTESDNWAIRGVLAAQPSKRHIITTAVEHLAVMVCCYKYRMEFYRVTSLGVDRLGRLDLDSLSKSIRDDTALVSVMYVNNETGVLFPLKSIAQVVKEKGCLLHVDAVQALGKVPIDLAAIPVDLMSFSAHKIHGPKGIGALYVRGDTPIKPMFYGGGHEYGRRPGTENVPGIVGFGAAAALAAKSIRENFINMKSMRDRLESAVLRLFPFATVNGDTENRLPNTSNISFEGWDSRELLAQLDQYGVEVSGGSACCAHANISHVLQAMNVPPQRAKGAIRFSLSRFTTPEEIQYVLNVLRHILSRQT
ncbi:aminotransferase class V-fold PLP-dependent enzyme [bacterium]|nr:aminotransferase class V-fold PLP-dependent enzyme [bacterium]